MLVEVAIKQGLQGKHGVAHGALVYDSETEERGAEERQSALISQAKGAATSHPGTQEAATHTHSEGDGTAEL